MKRTKVDGEVERQVLTAMIVSKEFLGQAAPVLQQELEALKDAPLIRLVAEWCLAYHADYQDAPRAHVEAIYHAWAEDSPDQDLAESVHDLLEELSERHEEAAKDLNVPFLLERLGQVLTKRKLRGLQEDLDAHLSRGDAVAAAEAVAAYRGVEVGTEAGVDVLGDRKVWAEVFAQSMDPIIEMPGDSARFYGRALVRDGLVVVQAAEKKGKSAELFELCWRAVEQHRKVALFEVGDMSRVQTLVRLGIRLAGRPIELPKDGKPIRIPRRIRIPKDPSGKAKVSYHHQAFRHAMTEKSIRAGRRDFMRANGLDPEAGSFRLSVHAMGSVNVRGIESVLDRWLYESGFVPDVIAIDYADILAPEDGNKRDEQDEVNGTWKAMRGLSQRRHALVLTATQANAASYEVQTQGMKHFSRDKRKLAHVTGLYALNQLPPEKDDQVMRKNWIVARDMGFSIHRCLYVGTCLPLAQMCTTSAF